MIGKPHQWSVLVIGLLLVICSSNINWGKDHWRTVLQADAKGYYAYLPSLIIEQDLHFGNFERIENGPDHNPDLFYDYRFTYEGHIINKYFLGIAVLQLPFFLAAHGYCLATGAPAYGYSKPYIVAVNIAAIIWILIGLWALSELLLTYAITSHLITFTLVIFVFGTNLFYYGVVAPGMSHAYSFGLCTMFLLVIRRSALEFNTERLVQAGIIFGLIILIRPVNGIILLAMPLLFSNVDQFKDWVGTILSNPTALIVSKVIAISIISLQLVYYFYATGEVFVYSYGEEGFNWTDPHIIDILFSYKKGLFLYLPVLTLSLVGLGVLWKRSIWATGAWIIFFLVLTYVLSSWWNWWYGGSFGSRPYVEYFALFAIPFAMALQHFKPKRRMLFSGVAVALLIICQLQTYQARYYRIHWENMTKEHYWNVFLDMKDLE